MSAQEVDTQDRLALRALVDAYSTGVTVRDATAISNCFAKDGDWRVAAPINIHISGREEIGAGIAGGLSAFEFLVQMVHSVTISLAGDRATLRCVMQEMGRGPERGSMVMLGLYDDEAVRTPEGWRFASRVFKPLYIDQTPLVGQAVPLS